MKMAVEFYFEVFILMVIVFISVGFVSAQKQVVEVDDYFYNLLDTIELTNFDYEVVEKDGLMVISETNSKTIALLEKAKTQAEKVGWKFSYEILDKDLTYAYENGKNTTNININSNDNVKHCIRVKLSYKSVIPLLNVTSENTKRGLVKSYN